MKNKVAQILKVYAILNAAAGVFLGLYFWNSLSVAWGEMVVLLWISSALVVSFGIFAFGEVVQLLQDIKNATSSTAELEKGPTQTLPQI